MLIGMRKKKDLEINVFRQIFVIWNELLVTKVDATHQNDSDGLVGTDLFLQRRLMNSFSLRL